MAFFKKHRAEQASAEDEPQVINEDPDFGLADADQVTFIPVEKNKSVSRFIGAPTQTDTFSPASISIDSGDNPDTILIDESGAERTYSQPYYVPAAGYPRQLGMDVLRNVISLGWVDISLDIHPQENQIANRDLTRMKTIIEGNLMYQSDKGMQFQTRDNLNKAQSIENLLNGVMSQTDAVFHLIMTFLVYGDNPNQLKKRCDQFAKMMGNEGFTVQKLNKRVKSGFLQTIPIGTQLTSLDDALRIIDSHALAKLDPAQNEKGRFNGGIPFAINQQTAQQNMEYLNIFGTEQHAPANYNMGVVGSSGYGKSFAVKVKLYREVTTLGYYERSIDPQREYVKLARRLGPDALNLDFTEDSDLRINPCRLTIAERPVNVMRKDDTRADEQQLRQLLQEQNIKRGQLVTHGGEYYVRYVPIQNKINQLINFIRQIYAAEFGDKEIMTPAERNILAEAFKKVLHQMAITADPESLFTGEPSVVDNQYFENTPKQEPTLSDIVRVIREDYYQADKTDTAANRLLQVLSPYLRDGSTPIFDGQTFYGYGKGTDLSKYHYVNFNISELHGSFKQIAAYVIAQINWDNWITNPDYAEQKKVLCIDEVLEQIKNPIFGDFIETAVRQARKFNASIVWLAQDLDQLKDSNKFRPLISNSNFFFFAHVNESERHVTQSLFNLNNGVMDRLCSKTEPGEGILMDESQQLWVKLWNAPGDMEYAESNEGKMRARKRQTAQQMQNLDDNVLARQHRSAAEID